MSYAEMEGLVGHAMPLDVPLMTRGERDDRLIRRWIAFAFSVFLFLVLLVTVGTAAMP